MSLFSVDDRDRARDRVLELAVADQRVVAGAVVGSLALDDGDRWSDLDLTFAVADERQLPDVLADWTRTIVADLDAVPLFDVSAGETVYRVFVLPGCLQLDLSFAPAASFGALGPKFRLLFGSAVERPFPRLLRHASCSASRSTTRCGRASASSGAATGTRSTGSAASATTRSTSPACGAGFAPSTAAASTTCRPTSERDSPAPSSARSTETSCSAPSAARSTGC